MDKFLTYAFLIRIGLGFVFLANSLTAFFAPQEFTEIIEQSFLSDILPIPAETFVVLVGFNDLAVAFLLFFGIGLEYVAAWAAVWILGVMTVRGSPLEILEETGFLAMALVLATTRFKYL